MTPTDRVNEIERWVVEQGALTTDETCQNEFAGDIGPEFRQILAVRTACHVVSGTHHAQPADPASVTS